LPDDPVQSFTEHVDVARLDGEAGGHRVAAVLRQEVAAAGEGFGDVNARDAAAAPLPVLAVERDDAGRPPVVLHEPRRREADDAGRPGWIGDDGGPRVRV